MDILLEALEHSDSSSMSTYSGSKRSHDSMNADSPTHSWSYSSHTKESGGSSSGTGDDDDDDDDDDDFESGGRRRRRPRRASSRSATKRLRRERNTPEQAALLERVFASNPMPSTRLRQELAEELNLPPRRVQIWFQNRRAKVKRDRRSAGMPPPDFTRHGPMSLRQLGSNPKLGSFQHDASATSSTTPLSKMFSSLHERSMSDDSSGHRASPMSSQNSQRRSVDERSNNSISGGQSAMSVGASSSSNNNSLKKVSPPSTTNLSLSVPLFGARSLEFAAQARRSTLSPEPSPRRNSSTPNEASQCTEEAGDDTAEASGMSVDTTAFSISLPPLRAINPLPSTQTAQPMQADEKNSSLPSIDSLQH